MADAIKLDPGSYRGTYKLIGGAPALDFANLVSYRGTDREHDWLEPAENIAAWIEASGITAPVSSETAELLEFREVLARTFLAVADRTTPAPGDIEQIGEAAAGAWAHRQLTFPQDAVAATWITAVPSLRAVLAFDAAELLTSAESLARIAACHECRWVFLDTTRNRSRQWCDPADCGNRARQRRHYEASRARQR